MDIQASFGVLSEVIEQYESRGRSVRNVEATAADAGDTLRATLSVPVRLRASADAEGASANPETATLDDDRLRVDFSIVEPALPETDAAAVTVTDRSVRVADDGDILLTVDLTIEPTPDRDSSSAAITGTVSATDPGTETDDRPADGPPAGTDGDPEAEKTDTDTLAAVRDESVPPYEDEPYLRRLYEVCDTFEEMRHVIPMDISAETVRRYMIEAGIHDPTTYDTANEATDVAATDAADDTPTADDAPTTDDARPTDETTTTDDEVAESAIDPMATVPDEQLIADGIGLPAELSIADVADAVVESGTMYEVRERLDLDPRRTRELLQQLDLIDLVMRRIGDDTPRNVTHETVAHRLRECARSEPDTPTAT